MKKQWTEPSLCDMSILNTEAALLPRGEHDGVTYDTTVHFPNDDGTTTDIPGIKFEGHDAVS